MRKMKKLSGPFIILLLAALLVTGCSEGGSSKSSSNKEETYKIGVVLSLTGPAGWLGENTKKSIDVLSQQINDDGGINNHPVELVYFDDASKPEEASKGTKKLITEDKVSLLIGPNGTPTSIAAEQVASAAKVPMISMSGGYVPDPNKGWGWAIVHSTDQVIERQFQYFQKAGLTKVGVLNPNDALGQVANGAIEKLASKYNIDIVASESFNLKDINMKPQLNSINGKGPQIVIAFVTGEPAVSVRKQMTEIGMNIPMFAPHSSATNDFIKLLGSIDEGMVMAAAGKIVAFDDIPEDDPQKKVMADFIERFESKYNYVPGYIEGFGYDALNTATQALKKVGSDPEKIKEYLESGKDDLVGINGIFTFTKKNRIGLSPDTLRIVEVKDNKWTLIE